MTLEVTLTDAERDSWIEQAAIEVARRRLETPAVLFLELHRPLAFLGSQALIVATPFLGPFAGPERVLKLSRILEDRRNVERLINRIEELAAARENQRAAPGGSSEPEGPGRRADGQEKHP